MRQDYPEDSILISCFGRAWTISQIANIVQLEGADITYLWTGNNKIPSIVVEHWVFYSNSGEE